MGETQSAQKYGMYSVDISWCIHDGTIANTSGRILFVVPITTSFVSRWGCFDMFQFVGACN